MQHPDQEQRRDQQTEQPPRQWRTPHSEARQSLPLLLLPREVDALYDALELTAAALRTIGVPFTLLAGSLLGAVRSRSMLFCDDDIDIGVMACDYARVRSELPRALGAAAKYAVRPWPAADRIRPRACPQVWIDVFVLQEYQNESDLVAVISAKENGTLQPADYVAGILRAIADAGVSFPCVHYDNRKAIEMWPREFFLVHEFHIAQPRLDIPFAHLGGLPIPALPLPYLRRAYGEDCLEYFRAATNHDAYSCEFRERRQQLLSASAGSDRSSVAASEAHGSIHLMPQSSSVGSESAPDPSSEFAFVAAALRGELLSLRDCDFRPLQHSRRNKRIEWSWSRQELAQWVTAEDAAYHAISFSTSAQSASSIAETAASCTRSSDPPQSASLPTTLATVAVSAASATASAAAAVSAVRGTIPLVRPGWFGAAMAAATAHSATAFHFTPELLAVMEPHVQKARALRAERAAPVALQRLRAALDASPAFCALRTEAAIDYDAAAYPLGALLAAAIGLPPNVPIAELHLVSPQWASATNLCESSSSVSVPVPLAGIKQPGLPSEAAKRGKDAMMARLRDANHCAPFHTLFDRFVCEVIAPALMAASIRKDCASRDCNLADGGDDDVDDCHAFYYQAFPCVRLIQPGEFSLGVHCDSAYGFAPTNLNIVVPLTAANGRNDGAAELYVESQPGAEDWHSLIERHTQGSGTSDTNGARGRAIKFWGSQCLHWTSENTTAYTRASLDFRVIPAAAWCASHECEAVDTYAGRDGYYHCARRRRLPRGSAETDHAAAEHSVSDEFVWVREAPMFAPDPRVGYPFIVKKVPGAD